MLNGIPSFVTKVRRYSIILFLRIELLLISLIDRKIKQEPCFSNLEYFTRTLCQNQGKIMYVIYTYIIFRSSKSSLCFRVFFGWNSKTKRRAYKCGIGLIFVIHQM